MASIFFSRATFKLKTHYAIQPFWCRRVTRNLRHKIRFAFLVMVYTTLEVYASFVSTGVQIPSDGIAALKVVHANVHICWAKSVQARRYSHDKKHRCFLFHNPGMRH